MRLALISDEGSCRAVQALWAG